MLGIPTFFSLKRHIKLLKRFDDSQKQSLAQARKARVSVHTLLRRFRSTDEPVHVDFRKLVSWRGYPEYATHLIHPYPAKLLAHIPFLFLSDRRFTPKGSVILDPFCGSGTVLLEGVLAGLRVAGSDVNPLARMITRAKLSTPPETQLLLALRDILRRARRYGRRSEPPFIEQIKYWYSPRVVGELEALRRAIAHIEEDNIREFLQVAFSVCVRKVSLCDPRLSVPVRLRANQYPKGHWLHDSSARHLAQLATVDSLDEFESIALTNIARLRALRALAGRVRTPVIFEDARALPVSSQSVDFVVSSPPYAAAQKYIRASGLSLYWLGLVQSRGLAQLHTRSIGNEHLSAVSSEAVPYTGIGIADRHLRRAARINPSRARIVAEYVHFMTGALAEAVRITRHGGHICLVLGNSQLCGEEFPVTSVVEEILRARGMESRMILQDEIRSRGLMTRRNTTAGVIRSEQIQLWRRS